MTMADHVVVMREGVIEQQGKPLDLYDKPANKFVAGFIGSPAMNFIPTVAGEDGRSLTIDLGSVKHKIAIDHQTQPGRKVTAGIRPEHIGVTAPGRGTFDVPVAVVESTGSSTFVTAATTPELTIVETGRGTARAGETVGVTVDPSQLHLFDDASGVRL
jgi:multiple sugar transport system ATP-binding protein